jgi:multimeric flavodoxin WrbA
MNVVALNSSPHMDKGGTGFMLNLVIEGMKKAGADCTLFYTHTLHINPCLGCFSCWLKTPGACIQKDDMRKILKALGKAHILVLATPVYVDGMNSPLKTCLDRLIPLVEPFFEIRNNHCRHPPRENFIPKKVVLVSVCGFTELDNFDPLITHVKAFCKNFSSEYIGAVLRPYGGSVPHLDRFGIDTTHICEAAQTAGYQAVKQGKISPKIQETISQELFPRDKYIEVINASFQRQLEEE